MERVIKAIKNYIIYKIILRKKKLHNPTATEKYLMARKDDSLVEEYKVKVIIPKENDLSIEEMRRRIEDFQSIFVTVASRYYNQKKINQKGEAE